MPSEAARRTGRHAFGDANGGDAQATARKARVLIVGKLPPPYFGPAVATRILLESDLSRRYELVSLNTNVHTSLATIGRMEARKVWKNLRIYARYIRVLATRKPDLVLIPISQTTVGFLKDAAFVIVGALFGRRTLVQLRGGNFRNWLDGASPLTRAFVRSVLGRTRGVIVMGETLRHLFEPFFPTDRIFVVPNGADFEFPTVARGPEVLVLYLGNLQPSKGIDDVVAAVAQLRARGTDGFRLDVVGAWYDPDTRVRCLEAVAKGDLPVTFHGSAHGPDKFGFLAGADIFVFTPREPEGHPWAIVEALAAGLPIVATDQGAITESVLDGVNGLIVQPHRPDAVAAALARLLGDVELRARMGAASRRIYEESFTEERMVSRLGEVFDRLLGGPVPTPLGR